MAREPAGSGYEHGVPSIVRNDDDYERIMRRILEITDGGGDEPYTGELSDLLALAEEWEERSKS